MNFTLLAFCLFTLTFSNLIEFSSQGNSLERAMGCLSLDCMSRRRASTPPSSVRIREKKQNPLVFDVLSFPCRKPKSRFEVNDDNHSTSSLEDDDLRGPHSPNDDSPSPRNNSRFAVIPPEYQRHPSPSVNHLLSHGAHLISDMRDDDERARKGKFPIVEETKNSPSLVNYSPSSSSSPSTSLNRHSSIRSQVRHREILHSHSSSEGRRSSTSYSSSLGKLRIPHRLGSIGHSISRQPY